MAHYTTEVRTICEYYAGLSESAGFNDVGEIIEKAIDAGVIPPYNCFDDSYAKILSTKILYHYYTREIGFETVGLWRLKLQTKLNEIMKYYNQLYESELLKFEPLNDIEVTTTRDTTGNENKTKDNLSLRNDVRDYITENVGDETQTGTKNKVDFSLENESVIKENSGNEQSSENAFTISNENENHTSDISRDTQNNETTSVENNTTLTENQKTNNISDKTTNQTGASTNQYSETPQGGLADVIHGDYLTNATYTDSNQAQGEVSNENGEIDKTSSNDGTEKSEKDVTGNETETKSDSTSKSSGATENKDGNKTSALSESENAAKSGTVSSDENVNNTSNTTYKENSTTNYTTNSAANTNEKIDTTEKYIMSISGHSGKTSFSKSLIEFRETFLNIDMMVIEELQDLFIKLW